MTACLIVKATMLESGMREAFDAWYQNHHLPDALAAFNADEAWRGWSHVETDVHYAFYQFSDVEKALAISQSAAIAKLIDEFDATWQGRVERTRDVVEMSQHLQR